MGVLEEGLDKGGWVTMEGVEKGFDSGDWLHGDCGEVWVGTALIGGVDRWVERRESKWE